jgi:hypothetical protein
VALKQNGLKEIGVKSGLNVLYSGEFIAQTFMGAK